MKNTGTLTVALPTDREIVMTRVFDAPRRLVFDAFSKPELLKRWFGPRGWSLAACAGEPGDPVDHPRRPRQAARRTCGSPRSFWPRTAGARPDPSRQNVPDSVGVVDRRVVRDPGHGKPNL